MYRGSLSRARDDLRGTRRISVWRMLRDAKITQIYEATNQIQRPIQAEYDQILRQLTRSAAIRDGNGDASIGINAARGYQVKTLPSSAYHA
jgi:hypothetical protein